MASPFRFLPPSLLLLTGLVLGAAAGTGGFTFVYARGYSYLSDDASACVNCHVMNGQFEGWSHGSHHAVATCNDCHTPQGLFPKYLTKASNGWHHSKAFTTGDFPDNIQITPSNARIAQDSCVGCHASVVEEMQALSGDSQGEVKCVRCHGAVGHPL